MKIRISTIMPILLVTLVMRWQTVGTAEEEKNGGTNAINSAQYVVTTLSSSKNNATNNDLEELTQRMYFILGGIISPIVCIIGMISNILNMIVLARRRMRSSTNLFLFALAIADFSLLFVRCVYYIRFYGYYGPPIVPPTYLPETEVFFWVLLYLASYIGANISLTASNWLILSVTIYRFIAVCIPIRARRICTIARTRQAIVVIYSAALVLNIPDFFTLGVTEGVCNNQTCPKINNTWFYQSDGHRTFLITKLVLNIIVPWCACLILTVILIIKLKDSSERLRHISEQSTDENQSNAVSHRADDQRKISRMLILLVIWFLICMFPSALHGILSSVYSQRTQSTPPFLILRLFADVFLIANYASNFLLYAASNQLYREVLIQVLSCRKTRPETPSACTSNTRMTLPQPGSRFNSPMPQRRSNKTVSNSQLKCDETTASEL